MKKFSEMTEFEKYKILSSYDDYGDITSPQLFRRLIDHINFNFDQINGSWFDNPKLEILINDVLLKSKADKHRYSVMDYGAKGDGVSDDTQAIKDTLSQLKEGDELYFPNPKNFYLVKPQNETDEFIFKLDVRGVTITSNLRSGIQNNLIQVESDTPRPDLAVFEITMSNVVMENIYITGSTQDSNINIGYAIKTHDVFTPHLYFKDVRVNRFLKSGFKIITWMSVFERCFARQILNDGKAGIGFHITGQLDTSNNGTSVTMQNCYAYNVDIGFSLSHLVYSNLTSCACDDSGVVSYQLNKCFGLTLTSCGTENADNLALDVNECQNTQVNGLFAAMSPRYNNEHSAIIVNASIDTKITSVKFNGGVKPFLISYGSGAVLETPTIKDNRHLFSSGILGENSHQRNKILVNSSAGYRPDVFTLNEFYDLLDDSVTTKKNTIKQILNVIYLKSSFYIKLVNGEIETPSSLTLKGLDGDNASLIIEGEDEERSNNLIDVGGDFKIINNKIPIIFRNITFFSGEETRKDFLFNIKNSNVFFENCVLLGNGNSDKAYTNSYYFKLENSNVTLDKECELLGDTLHGLHQKSNTSNFEFDNPSVKIKYMIEDVKKIKDVNKTKKIASENYTLLKIWSNNTNKEIGDIVIVDNRRYEYIRSGTTGTTPPIKLGEYITDGSAVCAYLGETHIKVFNGNMSVEKGEIVLFNDIGLYTIKKGGYINSDDLPLQSQEVGKIKTLETGTEMYKIAYTEDKNIYK